MKVTGQAGPGQLYVDGHQLLFRAFYGFPARITSRDHSRDLTGVFGFFALLRAGIRGNLARQPEIVVVFDGEGGAARRQVIDPGYKAGRPAGTPEPIKALADVKRGLGVCGVRGSRSVTKKPTTSSPLSSPAPLAAARWWSCRGTRTTTSSSPARSAS